MTCDAFTRPCPISAREGTATARRRPRGPRFEFDDKSGKIADSSASRRWSQMSLRDARDAFHHLAFVQVRAPLELVHELQGHSDGKTESLLRLCCRWQAGREVSTDVTLCNVLC